MQLDGASLIVSFLVSGVGFVAFTYGRRQRRMPQLMAGVLLMVFPYFVSSVPLMLMIAVTLLAVMWGAVKAGY